MPAAQIVLEYLKVFLSAPVMGAVAAIVLAVLFRGPVTSLLGRIASLKVAGFGELQTSQSSRPELSARESTGNPAPLPAEAGMTPAESSAKDSGLEETVQAERERAYLWEYRYLNLYLVRGTQLVLDWFANRSGATTFAVYDNWWSSIVVDPNERHFRVKVLQSHHLLQDVKGLLSVSDKGREYLQWRGPLPSVTEGA